MNDNDIQRLAILQDRINAADQNGPDRPAIAWLTAGNRLWTVSVAHDMGVDRFGTVRRPGDVILDAYQYQANANPFLDHESSMVIANEDRSPAGLLAVARRSILSTNPDLVIDGMHTIRQPGQARLDIAHDERLDMGWHEATQHAAERLALMDPAGTRTMLLQDQIGTTATTAWFLESNGIDLHLVDWTRDQQGRYTGFDFTHLQYQSDPTHPTISVIAHNEHVTSIQPTSMDDDALMRESRRIVGQYQKQRARDGGVTEFGIPDITYQQTGIVHPGERPRITVAGTGLPAREWHDTVRQTAIGLLDPQPESTINQPQENTIMAYTSQGDSLYTDVILTQPQLRDRITHAADDVLEHYSQNNTTRIAEAARGIVGEALRQQPDGQTPADIAYANQRVEQAIRSFAESRRIAHNREEANPPRREAKHTDYGQGLFYLQVMRNSDSRRQFNAIADRWAARGMVDSEELRQDLHELVVSAADREKEQARTAGQTVPDYQEYDDYAYATQLCAERAVTREQVLERTKTMSPAERLETMLAELADEGSIEEANRLEDLWELSHDDPIRNHPDLYQDIEKGAANIVQQFADEQPEQFPTDAISTVSHRLLNDILNGQSFATVGQKPTINESRDHSQSKEEHTMNETKETPYAKNGDDLFRDYISNDYEIYQKVENLTSKWVDYGMPENGKLEQQARLIVDSAMQKARMDDWDGNGPAYTSEDIAYAVQRTVETVREGAAFMQEAQSRNPQQNTPESTADTPDQSKDKTPSWPKVNVPNKLVHIKDFTSKLGKPFQKLVVNIPSGTKVNGVPLDGYNVDVFPRKGNIESKVNGRDVTVYFKPGDQVRLWRGKGEERETLTIENPWDLVRGIKQARVEFRQQLDEKRNQSRIVPHETGPLENAAPAHDRNAMTPGAQELALCASNDSRIYPQLEKAAARFAAYRVNGQYEPDKAVKALGWIIDQEAISYERQFGDKNATRIGDVKKFTHEDRVQAATLVLASLTELINNNINRLAQQHTQPTPDRTPVTRLDHAAPQPQPDMTPGARELALFLENDAQFMQPVEAQAQKFAAYAAQGRYQPDKALARIQNIVDRAAVQYERQFGATPSAASVSQVNAFSQADRAAAASLVLENQLDAMNERLQELIGQDQTRDSQTQEAPQQETPQQEQSAQTREEPTQTIRPEYDADVMELVQEWGRSGDDVMKSTDSYRIANRILESNGIDPVQREDLEHRVQSTVEPVLNRLTGDLPAGSSTFARMVADDMRHRDYPQPEQQTPQFAPDPWIGHDEPTQATPAQPAQDSARQTPPVAQPATVQASPRQETTIQAGRNAQDTVRQTSEPIEPSGGKKSVKDFMGALTDKAQSLMQQSRQTPDAPVQEQKQDMNRGAH
ncbi:hypothetical protein [Bifidobacterium biavatii]|uniref:Uncharacterized protein n=1 Tax=Bifidobacterium biavatii DSM 23969 TaxID=1437608 RepID=A0A086ZHW2_9BIFI|nr:hypothetical protein [Bifidobacterium biavatii]KFI46112.1 hypothetical protein BBIA_2077 [Bifidobacterium biavatii DSM 23969]